MTPRRHWLWLLLLVPIALGLSRLRFDVEVLNLLPANQPVVQGLKQYQQNFSNARELLLVVKAGDPDTTEIAARELAENLRNATQLVARVTWQPPWMESPAGSAELMAYLWFNQPPEIFHALTNRFTNLQLTNLLQQTREALATSLSPDDIAFRGYDPLNLLTLPDSVSAGAPSMGSGDGLFVSADGTFRVMFVEATTDLASYRECKRWLETVQGIAQQTLSDAELAGDVPIRYTGRPAFVAEIAGGMERDMFVSVGTTTIIISLLFFWAHRRLRPLLWLLVLLAFILGTTLALGGLVIGELNVVSTGFAAILLGLAVDYGLVLFQEARANPNATIPELRRRIGPGILWAALTTAGAFLTLNFSGLPGLAQLGTLVAIGVPVAAGVMLYAYLPPLERIRHRNGKDAPAKLAPGTMHARWWHPLNSPAFVWSLTGIAVALAVTSVVLERPRFDHSGGALRPKNSGAYATVEEIKQQLGRTQEPLWVVVPGESEREVAERLSRVQSVLESAVADGLIHQFTLPVQLWPQPDHQSANKVVAAWLAQQKQHVHDTMLAMGFTENSFALTGNMLGTWQRAAAVPEVFWPTNNTSRWALSKVAAKTSAGFLCVGLIYPHPGAPEKIRAFVEQWPDELQREGVILSGWELLGNTMFEIVRKDLPAVLIPMFVLLLIALWLAYRRPAELCLSLGTLVFSALGLCAIMSLAGWSWNMMNLMAMPLLLGAGVDYSIHMQLALRRHHGNIREVRRGVGRALLVCGGTTCAAFGSLGWSSNAGLASLGQVCAAGVFCVLITAVYFLPVWWRSLNSNPASAKSS